MKEPAEQPALTGSGAVKDPVMRLRDVTRGWAEHGDSVKADDIYAACRSVAQLAEGEAVGRFVETRLLPLLLNPVQP